MRPKKNLNADYLYSIVRSCFNKVSEHRTGQSNIKISMADSLMSGLAVFSLKKPSLLSFEETIRAEDNTGKNLRNLFQIKIPASDTQMRAILDPVSPKELRAPFRKVFMELQRGNILKEFRYLDQGYLIALDGTGHYSSGKLKCDDCLTKKSRSGNTTHYHQLLGASIVHPGRKQVIPLCPEGISNRDGGDKQDCELAASKRWVEKFRVEHHKLEGVILGDALFASAPFINLLKENGLNYILGAKPDRHKAIFAQFEINRKHGLVKEHVSSMLTGDRVKKRVTHTFRFLNDLSLNNTNPDIKVNVLEYMERTEYIDPKQDKKSRGTREKRFTWITSMGITRENVGKIMRSGRARWKVENETFQTLKTESSYNLDHSYGHGKKNLCTILGMLTMLAFLIDQTLEIACPLFRKALEGKRARGRRAKLWGQFKSSVEWLLLDSWDTLLKLLAGFLVVPAFAPVPDDSS